MRVLLVATNRERYPYPVAPLGALCVAGAARAAGHQVDLLDLGLALAPRHALRHKLATGRYNAVAFSIRNLDNCFVLAPRMYFDEVRPLAETVRRNFTGPLLLGGSGFSVSPLGWMERLAADGGVVGEGERVFPDLLTRLETGQPLDGMDGVVTPVSPRPVSRGAPAGENWRLASLAPPAHDMCDYRRYVRRGGFVSVQTKRGCPFGCVYCIYPCLEGRRYRLRPPESVVQEIQSVAERSRTRHFFFVDSVFNDPRAHTLEICASLRRVNLAVRWSAFCNPVGFDAELAQAMARAGCIGVEFGLDAVTRKMLAAFRKPFGQAEIRTALKAARDARLPFAVHLLFGGPGETWTDVEEAQLFLNDCAPANSVFAAFGIRIYAGTALADVAAREGILAPEQDLFEPAYYISPGLAEGCEAKLDLIARRRPEWTSPMDWRRPVMRWAQKAMTLLDVRPQWKDIRGYGLRMRPHLR